MLSPHPSPGTRSLASKQCNAEQVLCFSFKCALGDLRCETLSGTLSRARPPPRDAELREMKRAKRSGQRGPGPGRPRPRARGSRPAREPGLLSRRSHVVSRRLTSHTFHNLARGWQTGRSRKTS